MPSGYGDNSHAIQDLLSQAVSLHQQGDLSAAGQLYQQILRLRPDHFHALHLLGLVALKTGQTRQGVSLIGQAIKLNDKDATAHSNLGAGLETLGRHQDALASYDRAIALNSHYSDAYFNRGNILFHLQRYHEAIASYDRAIALTPGHASAYSNRGNALRLLQRRGDAIASYDKAIALRPTDAEAHNNRGSVLQELKRYSEAIASYSIAIALRPAYAEAYSNRGSALQEQKRYAEAILDLDRAVELNPNQSGAYNNRGNALWGLRRNEAALADFDKAIALAPNYGEAHNNRGNALRSLGRHEEALESFEAAIALRPDHAEAYSNRGNALQTLQRHDEAIESYDKAIALRPDYAEAYSNRGNTLLPLRRHEEALANYDKAIALSAEYAEAYSNRGQALQELRRHDEALASTDKAIALKAGYAEAYFNQSLCLLQLGRFERGWQQYEWRRQMDEAPTNRSYPQPLWLGQENIAGKILYVYWEQGFGDTIQFCRYAALVQALGARVIMSVQDPLLPVLKTLQPPLELIGENEAPSVFDYHCPMMSLPLALATTYETIPSQPNYLGADDRRVARWADRLSSGTKPRIGVVWRGGPGQKHDYSRSMPLAALLPLLHNDAEWICLQKELSEADAALLRQHGNVAFVGDDLADFGDTAALCELMDLVITVDTGVAHLAGAMGKPVWVLLTYSPDWRWHLDRSDSPWYPSARLFRQLQAGDWDDVIRRVQAELRSWLDRQASR